MKKIESILSKIKNELKLLLLGIPLKEKTSSDILYDKHKKIFTDFLKNNYYPLYIFELIEPHLIWIGLVSFFIDIFGGDVLYPFLYTVLKIFQGILIALTLTGWLYAKQLKKENFLLSDKLPKFLKKLQDTINEHEMKTGKNYNSKVN